MPPKKTKGTVKAIKKEENIMAPEPPEPEQTNEIVTIEIDNPFVNPKADETDNVYNEKLVEDLVMEIETVKVNEEVESVPELTVTQVEHMVDTVFYRVMSKLDAMVSQKIKENISEVRIPGITVPVPVKAEPTASTYEAALVVAGLDPSDIVSWKEYDDRFVLLPRSTNRKVFVKKA